MERLKLLLLLLIVFPVNLTAQEEDWYLNKPISEIRFDGLTSISVNELMGIVRPYFGQPYTDDLSWDIQGKLYALDYFNIIIPKIIPAESDAESVILIFQVEEKPLVDDVVFAGNSGIRKGELADTVLVKVGDLLSPDALRADEQVIIDYYLEKGFIDVEVSSSYTIDEQNNNAIVLFTINEGSQTKISGILFVGNDKHVPDNALRNLIKTKAQSLFNKGLFVETKLQEDVKSIERYYGDRGLIDARILDVNKEIVLDEKQNLRKMRITFVIEEGDVWSYGGMTFHGNRVYSDTELEEVTAQQAGKVFNRTKFQIDFQNISDLYYENGYIFNNFTYEEIRTESSREITYAVMIVERDRAHIENIIIRGNDKTKSYVIRREIPLEEGEVFSKAKIVEGMMNLHNLQFFDVVEPQPYPSETDGLMNLIIDVSEGKTSDIGFGLSFSGGPDFPISGLFNWKDRNFFGRGQEVGAEARISRDVQSVTVQFTEPRLLGRRWSGGISLSWEHDVNHRINQDIDGNGLPDPYDSWQVYNAVGRVVPPDHQMVYNSHYISPGFTTGNIWPTRYGRFGISGGLRSTWEYINYDETINRPHNPDIRDNLHTWKYDDTVFVKISWDTRDLIFDATKGFVLSEKLTFAGILPTSRREYIKSVSRFSYSYMLFDIPVNDEGGTFRSVLYLNSAFQALFNKPWSDIESDSQRDGFYVDGMFIARGWVPKSGYRYLWDNTVQLKFPIVPSILAFDIFFDAVGSWVVTQGDYSTSNALNNMHISDWRFSLGGGLRFANPQFPIGIYLVKKFKWDNQGNINWTPEPRYTEFKNGGLDLVVAFSLDIY